MKLNDILIPKYFLSKNDFKFGREPKTKLSKFFFHPISRIFIGIVFLSVLNIYNILAEKPLLKLIGKDLFFLLNIIILFAVYMFYIKLVEKRKTIELGLKLSVSEFFKGILNGAIFINFIVLFLLLSGFYSVIGFDFSINKLLDTYSSTLFFVFLEEIVFRLIIFRLIEVVAGTKKSIIISSLIFAFAHSLNPNASLYTSIIIFIQTVTIISPAYLLTRRVWFVAGLHFAWNFFQRAIWNLPVSGKESDGIVKLVSDGQYLITGGDFGPEASILSIVVCGVAGMYYYRAINNKNKIKADPLCQTSYPNTAQPRQ